MPPIPQSFVTCELVKSLVSDMIAVGEGHVNGAAVPSREAAAGSESDLRLRLITKGERRCERD